MKKRKNFTKDQIGALISMIIVAVWGVWISRLHMDRPLGLEHTEIMFLSAMVPIYLILLPFYGLRVRWSYISGTIVLLGLFLGLIKSILDHTFFFSLSIYNLMTIAVLLIALVCIYFSLRSYLELASVGWLKTTIGIISLLAVSVIVVWQVSTNEMRIVNYNLEQVIHGIQSRIVNIDHDDGRITTLMAEGDIPSMVSAIIVNDEVVSLQGFGEDAEQEKLYAIGSITKSFVATAVLQLYERGQIDLDDDVNQYLPFDVRHPGYPDVPITIRMLLANRSCLAHNTSTYYAFSMGPRLRQWGVENRGWDNLPEVITMTYPDFMVEYLASDGKFYQPENWADCEPSTDFVYSTTGFDLLGYLIVQISGQPLNEYLQENIFEPLDMNRTTATPLDAPGSMAIPYERWYGVLAKTNVELPRSQRRVIGGGGLYSTAGDLANFLLAHMNQGRFGDFQMLKPETIAMMHLQSSETHGDIMQIGYGYGWGLYQEEPRQMWDITFRPRGFQGHGGRTWGYCSAMYMVDDAEGSYGYILLMNHSMVESMDHPWFFSIQMNIQDILLGEAHRYFQDSQNP
jgi:CubicO group peptidase (beta-lactamase class C family)